RRRAEDKAWKLANYFSTFRRFSRSRFLLSCRIIPLTQHSLTLELGTVGKAGRTGCAQPDHATKAKRAPAEVKEGVAPKSTRRLRHLFRAIPRIHSDSYGRALPTVLQRQN